MLVEALTAVVEKHRKAIKLNDLRVFIKSPNWLRVPLRVGSQYRVVVFNFVYSYIFKNKMLSSCKKELPEKVGGES